MPDIEPVIDDELGDVRQLIELAEKAAYLLDSRVRTGEEADVSNEITKVAARLKGRL